MTVLVFIIYFKKFEIFYFLAIDKLFMGFNFIKIKKKNLPMISGTPHVFHAMHGLLQVNCIELGWSRPRRFQTLKFKLKINFFKFNLFFIIK